jgi:hypothetical protein
LKLPKNETHLLVGASGAGKSQILLQAIQAWEQDRDFPIAFDATRIAYVTSDRAGSSVDGRIEKLGIKRIEHYNIVNDLTLAKTTIVNYDLLLNEVIKRLQHPFDLLVLDPIGLFLPSGINDYHKAAWGMVGMNRFAIKHNVTIIGVHHATKIRSDSDFLRPQDRISGSGALQGYTSSQIILIQGSEKKNLYDDLYVIHHDAPEEHYQLVRNPEGLFEIHTEKDNPKEDSKERTVLSVIRNGGDTFRGADVISASGVSKPHVYNILNKLKREGKLSQVGHGVYQRIGPWLQVIGEPIDECG